MTIELLIKVLTNKLNRLRNLRVQAEALGELESIISIELEIAETTTTLQQLQTLE